MLSFSPFSFAATLLTIGMKYYKIKQPSDNKLKRLQQHLARRLVDLFPGLDGQIVEGGYYTVGPFRIGKEK